jgi:signal transduction histidine kinase
MQRFEAPDGVAPQDVIPLITHDLRQPVTAIKGFCQLVLRQPDVPPRVERLLSVIVEQSNHLATMLEDVALVSRLERGKIVLNPTEVDLGDVARVTVEGLTGSESSGRIELLPESQRVDATCDPTITQRALALLIGNALRLATAGQQLYIAAKQHRGRPILWLATAAAGTTPEVPQLDAPESAIARVGYEEGPASHDLTLYLCTRLIETQHGQLWGENRPHGGSAYVIVLPPAVERGEDNRHSKGGTWQWS